MCTLSIVTREDGYLLGMNRDERTSRGAAAPPELRVIGSTRVAYPRDTEGGTWIGVNDRRATFALLNWTGADDAAKAAKIRSRGFIIPELLDLRSVSEVEAELESFSLNDFLPFRLVGVFPAERQFREWTWDKARLCLEPYDWNPRHWFSSGLSQAEAEVWRGAACRQAWSEKDAGSVAWLRRLHSSHANGPGALSVCVHREGVETVSYTEVVCDAVSVSLSYFPESPCAQSGDADWTETTSCTLKAIITAVP